MARVPIAGLARVDVDDLEASPANPRERLRDIDELAESMRSVGLIQPIVAQRIPGHERLRIVAGHRRWHAARKLGWRQVPVLVRRDMLPDDELVTMLIENGQRSGLDPIEEARAINRLVKQGFTQAAVARRIGRSRLHVSQRLMLLSLSPDEQEALRQGEDTIGAALEKAKRATGRVGTGKGSKNAGWHFAETHRLAKLARGRCRALGHSNKRRLTGAMACGECWEQVIRADERRQLHDASAARGSCVMCDSTLPDVPAEVGGAAS